MSSRAKTKIPYITKLECIVKCSKYRYYRVYIPREFIEEILKWGPNTQIELIPILVEGKFCLLVKKHEYHQNN